MQCPSIPTAWPRMTPGHLTGVSCLAKVMSISCYPASAQAYSYWQGRLAGKPGWSPDRPLLACWDMGLQDDQGQTLTVLLHPLLEDVVRGRLGVGLTIQVTRVSKVPGHGVGDFILVLHAWTHAQEPLPCTPPLGPLPLADYSSQFQPLMNPLSNPICPWTLSSLLSPPARPLPVQQGLRQDSLDQVKYRSEQHNLAELGEAWPRLCKMWPLVLRVLACSRSRLKFRCFDPRKPWICLSNLLVADTTGYCVITVWDMAVAPLMSAVREGDILLLGGGYKVSRFQPVNKALLHRLQPKVRGLGLSPLDFEIKLNISELDRVEVVQAGVVAPMVPPLVWNFVSVSNLTREVGGLADGRVVDLVGQVVHHGRWEREQCRVGEGEPTGQFWVRVWLTLMDQTSDQSVPVRLYVDRDRWMGLREALPGTLLVLTNLLVVREGTAFRYLDCGTETQVFPGVQGLEERRFSGDLQVRQVREHWETQSGYWRQVTEERGSLGGHSLFGAISSSGALEQFERREELVKFLQSLAFRGSGRVRVEASLGEVKQVKVDRKEGKVEGILEEYSDSGEQIFWGIPCAGSFTRSVGGRLEQVKDLAEEFCFLSDDLRIRSDDAESGVMEDHITIAALAMTDCQLQVDASSVSPNSLSSVSDGERAFFYIDLFRLAPFKSSQKVWEGVEAVLRMVQCEDLNGDATLEESILVTTQDLLDCLK